MLFSGRNEKNYLDKVPEKIKYISANNFVEFAK